MSAVETLNRSEDRAKVRPWGRDLATFSGWMVGSCLLAMLAWVAVPWLFLGWTPLVITSGSMSPTIRVGDVILVERVSGLVGPGTVIAFEQGDGLVVHRVTAVDQPGVYTTSGDANAMPDSTPVRGVQVIGQGRLLVPHLGLLRVMGGEWWLVVGAFAGFVTALLWRGPGLLASSIGLIVIAAGVLALASGTFVATVANTANTLTTVDPQPPAGLTATCGTIGAENVDVDLSWTPSPTTGITGYEVLYDAPSPGSDYSVVGSTVPATTEFTHSIPSAVVGVGTHTYVVRGVLGPWLSPFSNSDAVEITQIVVYICTEA